MYISPHEFKEAGSNLRIGGRTRIEHSCGDGRSLIVSKEATCIKAYCFRCHKTGLIPIAISLKERIANLAEASAADMDAKLCVTELPGPAETDPQKWPDVPRLWLYNAGFSNDEIMRNGWYWNSRMQRVVLPVFMNGALVYWQARGFDTARAKVLNPDVDKSSIVAVFGAGNGDCIALTEDVLSAAKVGAVTEAWALMGTVLQVPVLNSLFNRNLPVVLMLDDDPAGRKGARNASKMLDMMCLDNRQIYFGKDPKMVARADIRESLLKG